MDRTLAVKQLAQAFRDIEAGQEHIGLQNEIVGMLLQSAQDASTAKQLLTAFEGAQASHIAERDRLLRVLAKL